MKTLPEILRQHSSLLRKGDSDGTIIFTKFGASEATDAIAKELMGIIGEDEYHWNQYPNGVVFDFAMSPEMEASHNKCIDDRNQLRAEVRARLTAFIGKEVR